MIDVWKFYNWWLKVLGNDQLVYGEFFRRTLQISKELRKNNFQYASFVLQWWFK